MATVAALPRTGLNTERRFFFGLAIALALATLVGFTPTYYFVSVFHGTTGRGLPAELVLTPAVQLHGLSGSLWMLLLVTQTGLVSANRRDIHMKMGILAVALATAIAFTAVIVSLDAARRGSVPPGWTPAQFLLIQAGTMGGFLLFGALGLMWRRHADYHKRLMMLATISMMVPACGRIWGMLGGREIARGAVGGMMLSDLFLLALIVFDLRTRGRLHVVTLWGGAFLVGLQIFRVLFSETDAWQSIGRWLIA